MTSHVLTLIGNAGSAPLEAVHIERVYRRLAVTGKVDWLAEGMACDLIFESPLSAADITDHARDALSGSAFDAVCTTPRGRRKKLLVSDMDSTVIDQECIDELGDAIGLGSRIRDITAAVVRGDMSFSDALRQRMALMKGIEHHMLISVYEDRISLKGMSRSMLKS